MAVWALSSGLDCQKCNNQLKLVRGCEKDIQLYTIEGIEISKCPITYITGITEIHLQAYNEYMKGFLPNEGGWLNQPMKFSSIMNFIDNLMNKYQEDKNGR